jgi:hypothetical protein
MMGVDVRALRRKGTAAVRRFPLAFSSAAIAAATLVLLADATLPGTVSRAAWRLFVAAAFGFPLLVAVRMLAERKGWGLPETNAAQAAAVALAAACSFAVPDRSAGSAVVRFAVLCLGFFPLLTLAPFPGRGEINGFWHYNRALLARFLLALLVTQLVTAGIGFALAGMGHLVGADVPPAFYICLWIVITVPIGSVIFLRGIPWRPQKLQTAVEYPRWLGILTRAVLIPVVGLSILALYAYAATIVVRTSWPRGGVAGCVLGFSAAGILTYLLVYPVREKAESRLVPAFMRWFFPLLLPLAVLLFLSVWRRIAEYGVTERRYLGVVAAAWLAAACVYFIAGKAKNIKAVPASIAVLAFLSSFGPWGAPDVSARSQAYRLEKILVKNGLLSGGKIRPAAEAVPAHDEGEISRIVRFLSERNEMGRIARWCDGGAKAESGHAVMARMGLSYDPTRRGKELHFMARDTRSLKVAGYDYSVKLSAPLDGGNGTWEAPVDHPAGNEGRYRLVLDGKSGKLFLTQGRDTVIAADIVPLVRRLRSEFPSDAAVSLVRVPQEKLEIAETRGFVGIKVCFSEIVGTEREGTVRIGNVKGEVLVKTAP